MNTMTSRRAYAIVLLCLMALPLQGYFHRHRVNQSALSGSTSLGDPITITWSIVADGTEVDNAIFVPDGVDLVSTWIETMDDFEGVAEADRTTDLTNRAWFQAMKEGLDYYSAKTGIQFVYVTYDNDDPVGTQYDGSPNGSYASNGVKADIRIGGLTLSGAAAYSSTYNNGRASNVIMSTAFSGFYNATTGQINTSAIKGILIHEVGHSMGLDHFGIDGNGSTSIMGYNAEGPQFDDLRAFHTSHGDVYEINGGNDTRTTATALGSVAQGQTIALGLDIPADGAYPRTFATETDIVSIDSDSDTDYFSFSISEAGDYNISVTPRGPDAYTYYFNNSTASSSNGTAYPREASDLSFTIYDSSGSTISSVDDTSIGSAESTSVTLAAGDYYISVSGDASNGNYSEEFAYSSGSFVGYDYAQFYSVSVDSSIEVTTDEDVAVTFTLSSSTDASYTVTTAPANGTLSGTAPDLIYTPDADFNGTDSFTFSLEDESGTIAYSQVFFTVTAVADAPVSTNINVSTREDTAASLTLNGSDPDGSEVTYTIDTSPANGTLSGTAPNLTYTPDSAYVGSDTFTYYVNDGTSDSNTATVTITILDADAFPPALAHWPLDETSGTTVEDRSRNGFEAIATADVGFVSDGQIDNARSFNGSSASISLPAEAFATITNEVTVSLWAYGADNQPRSDTIFRAVGSSNERIISMHLPWSDGKIYWDAGDASGYDRISQAADAADYEGTWSHWVFTKSATSGEMKIFLNGVEWASGTGLTKSLSSVTSAILGGQAVSSGSNYSGSIDDVLLFNTALTADEVSKLYANNAPSASSAISSTSAETAVDVTLLATDADGNELSYFISTNPANGTLSGTAPNLVYTPDAGFTGTDSFTYYASDNVVNSADATINITVSEASSSYTSFITTYTTVTDNAFSSDPDGDGMVNGIEYVLGLDPSSSDKALPSYALSGDDLIFTFDRNADSTTDTTQVFQYSTDLITWTDLSLTGTIDSEVNVGTATDSVETVTITIDNSSGEYSKVFWRLQATLSE